MNQNGDAAFKQALSLIRESFCVQIVLSLRFAHFNFLLIKYLKVLLKLIALVIAALRSQCFIPSSGFGILKWHPW